MKMAVSSDLFWLFRTHEVFALTKAGAYAIQEHGEGIIDRIDGSYNNVMGLPTERLRATLERVGMLHGAG